MDTICQVKYRSGQIIEYQDNQMILGSDLSRVWAAPYHAPPHCQYFIDIEDRFLYSTFLKYFFDQPPRSKLRRINARPATAGLKTKKKLGKRY